MSKFNFSVYLNAYEDRHPSNAPSRNNFKWARDVHSLVVNNPINEAAQIAPSASLSLFSGLRALNQDGTTQYSIALVPLTTTTYELSWSGGTAPNFRTPRALGIDATTQILTTVNGPLETFTSSPGTYATVSAQIAGMIQSVTITANNLGPAGNSVILTANGSSTISELVMDWNLANPSNMITLISGSGNQIPNAPLFAAFAGIILGTASIVEITADNAGTVGNSVVLTGDGSSSINQLITVWNLENPGNTISLTSGDGTQIPAGGTFAFYTGDGEPATPDFFPITLTADNIGFIGNNIELIGDGASNVNTLIANWNIANPSNTVSLTAGLGGQIPQFGALFQLLTGTNPAMVDLAGGQNANIQLSGGTTATMMNTSSVVVGDYVTIGNLFNYSNQGTFQVLATGANSFTIANPQAVVEGPILLGSGFATQLQVYSAAGVQINDTVVINSGFSPATQGSYEITSVLPQSIQFSSTAILPQEGPITTEIIIYSEAKNLVYIESDASLNVIVNGVNVGNIEPFIAINAAQPSLPPTRIPGVFMFKTVIYSLSVTNMGLDPANVFFAAVE
jgi:hypothetical protein